MKTRRYLFFIAIFFTGLLSAEPNVIKAVKDELTMLTQYARTMVCDYQNGKPVHSLVAHYLHESHYVHTKASLSTEQYEQILTAAKLVDYTFQLSNNPESIHACFTNFYNEVMSIRQLVCNDPVTTKRRIPKKDYRATEKNAVHAPLNQPSVSHNIVVTKDIDDELSRLLSGISEGDQKKLEDAMAALENPVPSLFDVLMNNKGKIALGLVTLYAVLAKANDWPPYDKKPAPVQATWRSWLGQQINEVGETILLMSA